MIQTDAIVTGASPYSETTLLVKLLTRECGVVRVLAKGARRTGGSPQAAFELFARIETSVSEHAGQRLGVMRAPTLKRTFAYLRSDVPRLAFASLGLEALAGVAGLSPPGPVYFEIATEFLERMESSPGPGSLTVALMLALWHEAGLAPEVPAEWTPGTMPPHVAYEFEHQRLTVPATGQSDRHTLVLDGRILVPLLDPMRRPVGFEQAPLLHGRAGRQALDWLTRVFEDHLGATLKSARFLEKMVYGRAREGSARREGS